METPSKIIEAGTGAVKAVGNIADNLTTTQEEEQNFLGAIHTADMQSDSWLSKNIRPLFLIFACGGWLILAILSSFGIKVDPEVYEIIKIWGTAAVMFYFGSRGWQHVEKTRAKSKMVDVKVTQREQRLQRQYDRHVVKMEVKEDRRQRKKQKRLAKK